MHCWWVFIANIPILLGSEQGSGAGHASVSNRNRSGMGRVCLQSHGTQGERPGFGRINTRQQVKYALSRAWPSRHCSARANSPSPSRKRVGVPRPTSGAASSWYQSPVLALFAAHEQVNRLVAEHHLVAHLLGLG